MYSRFSRMYAGALLFLSCFLPGVLQAQLINYNGNGKVRILSSFLLLEIDTLVAEIRGTEQSAALLATLLPPAIDLGAAVLGAGIKHGPPKYSTSSTATASGAGFWVSEREAALPVLDLRRMVIPAGSGTPEEAWHIRLTPQLSADRTAFRYVLADSVDFRYAGVKTKRQFDYINMELIIQLRALAVTEGEYELYDMRTSSLHLPMMKAGSVYTPSRLTIAGGWFPFPPKPSYGIETEEADEVSKTVATRGTSNGKPDNDTLTTVTRTINKRGSGVQVLSRRAGNYEITVEVIEINPYRGRAMEREKLAAASLEPLAELLKAAAEK